MSHLYGGMDEPQLKIIDVFVCKMRRKLSAAGGENYIETVWGRGYLMPVLEAEEFRDENAAPQSSADETHYAVSSHG